MQFKIKILLALAITIIGALVMNDNKTEKSKIAPIKTPDFLYKVLSQEEWILSKKSESLSLGAIDTDFIHLSTKKQLNRIIKKFWDKKSYVVLRLDSKKLVGDLRFETNPGGESKYYHLYNGNIPTEAISDIIPNIIK